MFSPQKYGHSKKSCKLAKAEAEGLSDNDKVFWENVREDARPMKFPPRLVLVRILYLYLSPEFQVATLP